VITINGIAVHDPGSGVHDQRNTHLGPPPSLHPLRERSIAFVRSLRRSLAVSGVSTFVPVWVCHSSFLQLRCPLFGNFVGTTGRSDSLRPYIGGLRPQTSHRDPRRHRRGWSKGLPVLAHGASTHARGLDIDRARSRLTSRLTVRRILPSAPNTASAPGRISISRLNTRPACAPVNASDTPLQACPHDSGSSWVASPSMRGFFLRYTMPVYPGASPGQSFHRRDPPEDRARERWQA
jgi:hypothetical protein